MSSLYPIMLNLEGRTCVIIGGGAVAARKVDRLLGAGALVTVISPVLYPALELLAETGKITVQQVAYEAGMLAALHPLLVFAATDDLMVNQQVADEARAIGALVNGVDDQQGNRDFMSMATVQRGEITVSVSLGGASPALVAHLQRQIDKVIGEEYVTLADWMAEARPMIQTEVKSQLERAAVWRRVLESSILDTLRQGNTEAAQQQFDQIIEEVLSKSA